jgi:glycine cleavage system H protein
MEVWAGCAIPTDVFYDLEADVWVKIERDVAVIGMTDVAQTRMGRLVQLSWKEPGRKIKRGRPLSVLESAKWVGPMISPLTGEVVANNRETFEADIAIANRDPYGAGWLYKLALEDRSELDLLAAGEQAIEYYRKVIDENNIRCYRCEE